MLIDTLNNPRLTLTTFCGVVALVAAAWPYGTPYSEQDRAAMDDLIGRVTAPQTSAEKIVYLYGEE